MDLANNVTVTTYNGVELADELSLAFKEERITTVNGYELISRFGQPVAQSWQNGTVSITVRGRTKGKTNTIYFKVGQVLQAR